MAPTQNKFFLYQNAYFNKFKNSGPKGFIKS